MKTLKRNSLLITFILRLFLGSNTFAITKTSSQSGNWSSATTWGGSSVPAASDDVIINGGFNVSVDVSNASCQSIQLGGSALNAGAGTLSFNSGSQLTVAGVVNIGPFNSKTTEGSLIMASGGTLVCDGILVGRLNTWTAGSGNIQLTTSNTIPTDNNVIFNNLKISGGTTLLPGNLNVNGTLEITSGATLNGGANTLSVGGNWTNNGTFTGNTGTVIFTKNGNQTISGSGINNFNLLKVNLGTSVGNTLEVLSTHFNAPDGFLNIINGTFKISGSFSFSNTFTTGPAYNIDPTAGFWINNPNVTVNAQAGGVSVRGLLRLSAGTYNIGTGTDNSLTYVSGSSIIIEGGSLNIAGRITRNNATATTSYSQSGGIVTVVSQGSSDPTFAGFDLGAIGSSFAMSGGTIVIRNATSAPADFLNVSSVASVTGGTIQTGDASSAAGQTIRIQSTRPLGNLLVSNASAKLISSSLNVLGNIAIQAGTTLDANGQNISIAGNWSNNGTFSPGATTITFNGSGIQNLAKAGGETFGNLTISKASGSLNLINSLTVNGTFNLAQGLIAVGDNTLTLVSTVTGLGAFTSSGTGTVKYNQGSSGQNVLAGNYGNLIFSDFDKILASTGTIGISGTFNPGTATGHSVSGTTIDFNGGSQTIPAFAYNNVITSGSGTKTGSGTISVSGNLTNNSGITFSGTSVLNLNGAVHTNNGILNIATLSVGTGATLTNNGTITSSLALNGSGTFIQGADAMLNIGGSSGITTLNASGTGNTVNYSGVGQTLKSGTYHHLTLSGSGIADLTGVNTINGNFTLTGSVKPVAMAGMTVGGNFAVGTGTSFDAGSFSHTLKGNLTNSGTFIPGSSTFTLSGTNHQTVSGTSFNNLSVSNNSGVTMLTDVAVAGTLSLLSGAFAIDAYTLNLNGALAGGAGSLSGSVSSNIVIGGSGASTILPGITLNNLTLNRANGIAIGGDVSVNGALSIANGRLTTNANKIILGPSGVLSEALGQTILGNVTTTRNIAATSGTETFGNIGSDISLNGVAPGTTTVFRKTGITSTGNGHNSILRYFDITPTTNSGLNAGLVFHYEAADLNGQNANTLELFRSVDSGTTWNNMGGTATASSGIITVTGINNFSRWTAADNVNSIGSSAIQSITSVSPTTKIIADPTFILTVNGTNFVNGKSTIRFNGNDRTTTYINSSQLTASIPASDLLVFGSVPVTVFNASGGGSSNALLFIVNAIPVKVNVETAADGSGTVVSPQTLASGSAITVYAISRDASNNFIANVSTANWLVENISGGILSGDLIPSVDGKSAVLTGHVIGTADIKATSGTLTATPSGIITVIPGLASKIRIETAANGSGTIVPSQSLNSGSAITVYAIARDASNNFVANIAAEVWNLQNISGNVVSGDLISAADKKSAFFRGSGLGTATIQATSGTLTPASSGTISVTSITGIDEKEALAFSLQQNYPNPFKTITTISYQLPIDGHVSLKVFDMRGIEVANLVNETEGSGNKSVLFDANQLSSGIYFYRLEVGKYSESKKLILNIRQQQ